MSFNLFGSAQKGDIRVGYIDPERGFVGGLTVCEANKYAKLNPGTQFIFRRRDKIQFMNINEVNRLQGDDLTPSNSSYGSDGCSGIEGLDIYDDDGNIKDQREYPVKVEFSGGNGIGAQGNPIFGDDGGLLAVDLINGGWGYSYAPITKVFDQYGIGAGAVVRSIMIGDPDYPDCKFFSTVQTFENEEDFEDYDLSSCPEVNGFGRRYNAEGKDIGPWDPTVYASLADDPVSIEIQRYQDFLKSLGQGVRISVDDNLIRNWWTTRKEKPLKVTANNRTTRTVHNVAYYGNGVRSMIGFDYSQGNQDNEGVFFGYEVDYPKAISEGFNDADIRYYLENDFPGLLGPKMKEVLSDPNWGRIDRNGGWSEFMNKYAISPVPRSNAPGSDFAGIEYTIEWEEDFPYDGEYRFRYLADNIADIYLDNELVGRTKRFKGSPDKLKKFVTEGVHKIRVDLENVPILESGTRETEVFNTKEYIDKADRQLWRINPNPGKDGDFLSRYGVLPFDPGTERAKTDDYAGIHVIRWEYVDFPVSGNYNIEVMVDDEVDIYIGNRAGDGRAAIGNGLIDVNDGGDEVIIRKKGFSGPGKSTGKSLETRYFQAGKYRIRAELKQIRGKGISNGNPMALAIKIQTSVVEKNVVSAKSWNENPMGVSISIDAPLPPIPQEPKPVAEGRCPNNPIWTTRFPGSRDRWFPVTHPAWSKFTNRYAMSPILPLGTPDSEGGGIVYRTSWVIEAPYSGFYGMKGTVDNGGRILVDDKVILQGGYFTGASFAGDTKTLKGFRTENPETVKFPLSEGKHTITVEVENKSNITLKKVDKKVFSTSDWLTPLPTTTTTTTSETTTNEEWERIDDAFVPPVSGTGRSSTTITIPGDASFHRYDEGTYYKGTQIRTGGDWNNTDPYTNYIEWDSDTRLTLGNYHPESKDRFAIAVWKKRVTTETGTQTVTTTTPVATASQSPSAKGVVYAGPTQITSYKKGFLSPVFQDVNIKPNEEIQGKTWVMRWENVDFPVDGRYKIKTEVDDSAEIFVDGELVAQASLGVRSTNTDPNRYAEFTATAGKRTVEIRLSNIRIANTGFQENPTVIKVDITVPINVETGQGLSWQLNPVGISAILIPPPCPLEVVGKGKVCRVVVDDPGNGYPKPPDSGTGDNTYPVTLELDGIEVVNPGINYNCGVDQIVLQPSNGASLSYECDTFGRIVKVNVDRPARGFTRQPTITMPSDTGVNFQAVPRFRVVRDPVGPEILQEQIIQVTDLVGLKLTGYVGGRAYYGSVFYKEGVRYAGVYETPGQLIQVYDTLQESINAEVTTPPSAILRQGTDVRSNNPRLNIPGTPDTLT